MRAGVGSSGAVVSCLGGDGGRTPPNFLHWHVISLKLIFMHKLGIISCLIDD